MPVYENERGTFIFNSKDLCMIQHIPELIDAGIDSFKIEGRMKRPEYAAIVTKVYSDLLREHRRPTAEERDILRRVFSRDASPTATTPANWATACSAPRLMCR